MIHAIEIAPPPIYFLAISWQKRKLSSRIGKTTLTLIYTCEDCVDVLGYTPDSSSENSEFEIRWSVKLFLMERMHGLISSCALFGPNKFAMGESRSCFSLGKKTRDYMRDFSAQ